MVKLTNYLWWFMNVIVVNVNSTTVLICASTLQHLHAVEQEENNCKKINQVWPVTRKPKKKKKKQNSVTDS